MEDHGLFDFCAQALLFYLKIKPGRPGQLHVRAGGHPLSLHKAFHNPRIENGPWRTGRCPEVSLRRSPAAPQPYAQSGPESATTSPPNTIPASPNTTDYLKTLFGLRVDPLSTTFRIGIPAAALLERTCVHCWNSHLIHQPQVIRLFDDRLPGRFFNTQGLD